MIKVKRTKFFSSPSPSPSPSSFHHAFIKVVVVVVLVWNGLHKALHSVVALALSLLLLSALGLLPALLLESDPNAVFCNTPLGDEPRGGLLSHPSFMRLRAEVFLPQ